MRRVTAAHHPRHCGVVEVIGGKGRRTRGHHLVRWMSGRSGPRQFFSDLERFGGELEAIWRGFGVICRDLGVIWRDLEWDLE